MPTHSFLYTHGNYISLWIFINVCIKGNDRLFPRQEVATSVDIIMYVELHGFSCIFFRLFT